MPARKAPATVLEVLQARARMILDILEGYIDGPAGPSDPAAAATAIGQITNELLKVIPDLASAAVATSKFRFLVPTGQDPGRGQVTEEKFFHDVAKGLADAGAIPQDAVNPTAAAMGAMSNTIGIDGDTWVRWVLGMFERIPAADAVAKLLGLILDFMLPYGRTVRSEAGAPPADFPGYDDSKEAQLVNATMPDSVAKLIKWTTAGIPGGTSVSTRKVGQAVHKHVIGVYLAEHPDHLVVGDGRVRVTLDPVNKLDLVISKIFTQSDVENWPELAHRDKLAAFWHAMRDPVTYATVRPDIADLTDAAQGMDPDQNWGWFEIKPMHSLARAFQELFAWYMPLWNDNDLVKDSLPEWTAQPGTWQPPLCALLPDLQPMRIYAALNVPPGCIGYLSVEIKDALEATAKAAVLTAMAALLAKTIFLRLRQLFRHAWEVLEPVLFFIGCVIIGALLLVLLMEAALVAAAVLAPILAFIGMAIERGNLLQRIQHLIPLLPTPVPVPV
jgi:hypothetical protein